MSNLPEPFTMIPVFITGPTYAGRAVVAIENCIQPLLPVPFNAYIEKDGVHWSGSASLVDMGVDSTPMKPEEYSYFSKITQIYPHVSGGEEYEKIKETFETYKKIAWKDQRNRP